jgi:hypothetical protein
MPDKLTTKLGDVLIIPEAHKLSLRNLYYDTLSTISMLKKIHKDTDEEYLSYVKDAVKRWFIMAFEAFPEYNLTVRFYIYDPETDSLKDHGSLLEEIPIDNKDKN